VNFQDVDSHLIAVGDSIIWANRMASAGHAGDVVLNNLLYAELKDHENLEFVPVEAKTKAGETFRARFLRFREQPDAPGGPAD
jgi:hypothetical protein